MSVKKVTDSILYVGVDDKEIDLFESQFVVPEGISYNSYIIMDEKIAILDTVDKSKTSEWLSNVEDALSGKTPDYVIISHAEGDHCASLVALLKKYQLIEPLDLLEELNESTRIVIYPSIHAVLAGDDIRELLETFSEEEHFGKEGETAAVQGTLEDLPE